MKKLIHIIEILIWIVVISSLIIAGISIYNHYKPSKSITINFKDIDGLAIGAPVNFMGVKVGSVTDFTIEDQRVLVDFDLSDNKIKIPKNSTVTIQFTGLVGSKTLEIEPPFKNDPENTKNDPHLIAVNPLRITNFIEISAKNIEAFTVGSKNILKVFGEGTIIKIKHNIRDANIITYKAFYTTESGEKTIRNAKKTFIAGLERANNSINNYSIATDKVIASMNTRNYDEDTKAILRITKHSLKYFYINLKESNYKRYFEDLITAGSSINRRLDKKNLMYFQSLNIETILNRVERFNNWFTKVDSFMDNINNRLENFDAEKVFTNIIDKLESAEEITKKMEKAI